MVWPIWEVGLAAIAICFLISGPPLFPCITSLGFVQRLNNSIIHRFLTILYLQHTELVNQSGSGRLKATSVCTAVVLCTKK